MKLTSVLLLLICTLARAAEEPKAPIELEFEYAPSFKDSTVVWMSRLPDGSIECYVLTRPDNLEPGVKWKRIKEVKVSAEDFARIEAAFETVELRQSAERGWPAIMDGTGWRLRKKMGARTLEIRASSPERDPAGAPIIRLGQEFAALAGAPTLSRNSEK